MAERRESPVIAGRKLYRMLVTIGGRFSTADQIALFQAFRAAAAAGNRTDLQPAADAIAEVIGAEDGSGRHGLQAPRLGGRQPRSAQAKRRTAAPTSTSCAPTPQFLIGIEKADKDKRQTLTAAIDMNLMLAGARITAGDYRVTIERHPAAEVPRG